MSRPLHLRSGEPMPTTTVSLCWALEVEDQ